MVELFFDKIVKKLGQKVVLMQLVIFTDKKYRSLSTFEVVNSQVKENLKMFLKERLHLLQDNYVDLHITSFFYKIQNFI